MNFLASAAYFALGLLAGGAHFASLRGNARLFAGSGSPAAALGLQLLRLGALAGLLVLVALHGALPLLATALGVLVARSIVVRRLGSVAG